MIRIVTDSLTLYSVSQGKTKGINIAPLSVTIDNRTYKEFEEIQSKEFVEIIKEGHLPMSSQPSIGDVLEIYNSYPDDEIINITMADGLSGTYNSACMAAQMLDNPERVSVINSKTLCGPHRYIIDIVVKLVEMNKTRLEIVDIVNEMIENSKSFLIPNDFDYLVRGGRLSPLVGKVGKVMKLVPVMTLTEDCKKLTKFATKRTFSKGIEAICKSFIESGVDERYKIYITHGCAEELANNAKKIILDNIPNADVELFELSPVFITQGGPGCLAIQMIKKY